MGNVFTRPLVRRIAVTVCVGTAAFSLAARAGEDPPSRPTERLRAVGAAAATATDAPTTTTSTVPPTTTTTVPPTTTTTLPVFDAADQAPGWERRRGEAALARVAYDWQSIGYTIRFLPARPGYLGMTYPREQRIDVWVRPDESLEMLTHIVAHELGHAVDVTWNDAGRHGRYLAIRGISPRNWFTCDGCTDFSTPAGDFAEVFATWATGVGEFKSRLAPVPSPEQLAQLAPLFGPPAA